VLLLTRTSRRVELTAAGTALLRDGRALLEQSRNVLEGTRAAGSERLVIGFFGSAAATQLPEIIRRFSLEHPATELTVRELMFDRLHEVAGGLVDLAFTRLLPGQVEDGRIEIEVIAEESRMLVVPAAHRLSSRASVRLGELGGESFVINPSSGGSPSRRWLAEQHRHGLEGRVATEAASLQELLTSVAAGRGVSLVPASVVELYQRPDLVYIAVPDAEPAVVSIAHPAGRRRPIAGAFIEQARAILSTPAQATRADRAGR
jgi:DNA-binding transcriptional LysR family regulator